MGSVSCVSCVSRRCSVNAAETHETVRWESGMRYQTHTPDAPGPRPRGVFIADRLAWQMNLPTRPQRLVILAEDQFGEIGSKTALGVIRYGRDTIVAVIDSTRAGRNVRDWLRGADAHPAPGRPRGGGAPP